MKLDKELILCHKSQLMTVKGMDYFIPQTTIKCGYIYDWITNEMLYELYNNAQMNVRDYSVYTEQQEEILLGVFFTNMNTANSFTRFRSMCMVTFPVISRCFEVDFDKECKADNNLWCGMPYHIYRLFLGIYYDTIVSVDEEDVLALTWFSELYMDSVFYQLLSVFVHVSLNSPGEIFEGYDIEDLEDYSYENADIISETIRNIDRSQRYLQKTSQFVAQGLKGKMSNKWDLKGDKILLCPLTRNLLEIFVKCKIGMKLQSHPILDGMEIYNIMVRISEFEFEIFTTHENITYLLSPHVIGAVYLTYLTNQEDYSKMYDDGELMDNKGQIQEDISKYYMELKYNKVLEDIGTLSDFSKQADFAKYKPLLYLDNGYLVKVVATVFVSANSTTLYPIPIGVIMKDYNTVEEREHLFVPFFGSFLNKLSEMGFSVEDGLPLFKKGDITAIDIKELQNRENISIGTIRLDINLNNQSNLSLRLIQEEFKTKIGLYSKTYIPHCFWDIEEEIDANFKKIYYK